MIYCDLFKLCNICTYRNLPKVTLLFNDLWIYSRCSTTFQITGSCNDRSVIGGWRLDQCPLSKCSLVLITIKWLCIVYKWDKYETLWKLDKALSYKQLPGRLWFVNVMMLYKVLLFTYKATPGKAPAFLSQLLSLYYKLAVAISL